MTYLERLNVTIGVSNGDVSPKVLLTAQVEAVRAQALHEGNEWHGVAGGWRQALQFAGGDDRHGMMAANGHRPRSFGSGAPDELSGPRPGILKLPAGLARAGRSLAGSARGWVAF